MTESMSCWRYSSPYGWEAVERARDHGRSSDLVVWKRIRARGQLSSRRCALQHVRGETSAGWPRRGLEVVAELRVRQASLHQRCHKGCIARFERLRQDPHKLEEISAQGSHPGGPEGEVSDECIGSNRYESSDVEG